MRTLILVLATIGLAGCAGGACLPPPPAMVIQSPIAFTPAPSPAALGYTQTSYSAAPLAPQAQSYGCAPAFTWAPPPAPMAAPAGIPGP